VEGTAPSHDARDSPNYRPVSGCDLPPGRVGTTAPWRLIYRRERGERGGKHSSPRRTTGTTSSNSSDTTSFLRVNDPGMLRWPERPGVFTKSLKGFRRRPSRPWRRRTHLCALRALCGKSPPLEHSRRLAGCGRVHGTAAAASKADRRDRTPTFGADAAVAPVHFRRSDGAVGAPQSQQRSVNEGDSREIERSRQPTSLGRRGHATRLRAERHGGRDGHRVR